MEGVNGRCSAVCFAGWSRGWFVGWQKIRDFATGLVWDVAGWSPCLCEMLRRRVCWCSEWLFAVWGGYQWKWVVSRVSGVLFPLVACPSLKVTPFLCDFLSDVREAMDRWFGERLHSDYSEQVNRSISSMLLDHVRNSSFAGAQSPALVRDFRDLRCIALLAPVRVLPTVGFHQYEVLEVRLVFYLCSDVSR